MNAPMKKAESVAITSLHPEPSTGDTLSILLSNSNIAMAKTWLKDGKIRPYSNAKYFKLIQKHVKNIYELSKLLKRLESERNACLIRGSYVGDDLARVLTPRNEYKAGYVLRRIGIFEDQPLHAVMIEVDDFIPEISELSYKNPLSCIREYIQANLPLEFHHCSFHWQLSNSAGHPDKLGVLKVHLWFWLSMPRTSAELKAWAKYINLNTDHSVFNSVQIHYTSKPIFEQGLVDPISERSGFFLGSRGEVDLEIDHVIPVDGPDTVDKKPQKVEQYDELGRICALKDVNNETIQDLDSALKGMKPERADDYKSWIDVLEALASLKETPFSDEAHALAHEFSQRCPEKYVSESLNKTWKGLDPTRITHRSIFMWAQEDGWINPRKAGEKGALQSYADRIDYTDAGNVALLANITDGNLRYIPERRIWLWWNDEKWVPDQYGIHAQECALKVAEYYFEKALELHHQAQDKALDTTEIQRIKNDANSIEKWARQCRNKRMIDSMLGMAKADERFTLSVNALDRDPWLFGVDNGVVDLRTGNLCKDSREFYVTHRSPIRYNPDARSPLWCQFIEEITAIPDPKNQHDYNARPDLADYLQRLAGYLMTGSTAEHKMFICIGEGSNGKNVLLDTMQRIMGDYCQTIPAETLMALKQGADAERPSPTTAMLAGSRAAISSESKARQKLDVALVKQHTGGGYLTARYLRENTFRFEITHKLLLMTNHQPSLDHMDEALRGRLHLIPFDRRWNRPGHPERNPLLPDGDKDLPERLKKEEEGILAWMVLGAVAYAQNGLIPSDEIMRMTKSYFIENDLLGRWLEHRCEPCDAKIGMRASDLNENFKRFCFEEGDVHMMSQKFFSEELKKRGIPNHKLSHGMHYGLRVLEHSTINDG